MSEDTQADAGQDKPIWNIKFGDKCVVPKSRQAAVNKAINEAWNAHFELDRSPFPTFITMHINADIPIFDHAEEEGDRLKIVFLTAHAGNFYIRPHLDKGIESPTFDDLQWELDPAHVLDLSVFSVRISDETIEALMEEVEEAKATGDYETLEDGTNQIKDKTSGQINFTLEETRSSTGHNVRLADVLAGAAYMDATNAGDKDLAHDVIDAFYGQKEDQLPKQDAIVPRTHYQGISKVTDKATEIIADGKPFQLNMGGDNEPPVYTILSLSYEGDDIKTSKPITPYDESVQNAVATLWAAAIRSGAQGPITITPTQVWRVMTGATGKSRPSKKSIEDVIESMDKQRRIFVTIDWTAELRGATSEVDGEKITVDKCKQETYMLNAEKRYITTTKGTKAIGYVIHDAPIFYQHDNATGQITSYPQKLLEATAKVISSTPLNLTMRDYAIKRIARMRHGNSKTSRKIAYDTWFKAIGREDADRKDRGRMMATARKILNALKGEGFISEWREYEKGGSSHRIEGVEIVFREAKQNKR